MLWAYSVLFLGWLSSGLESQLILTQPSSMSASPGSTLNIPCHMNSGYTIDRERARWHQQKPGAIPRFLYHYYKSTDQGRGTGVPERFSVSPEPSQTWNLVINGVQVEDEAVYYCSTWDYKLTGYVFGGGTDVTVTGQPTVSPSVQVFAPSREEVGGQNPYTVVCLVSEFYPPGFTLQWKDDKNQVIPSGAETTKATKQGDKYLASSYLRLSAPEYEKHSTFTCEVTHESKTIAKTVSKSGSC